MKLKKVASVFCMCLITTLCFNRTAIATTQSTSIENSEEKNVGYDYNVIAGSTKAVADILTEADENAIKLLEKQKQEELKKQKKEKKKRLEKAKKKKKAKKEKAKVRYYHIYKNHCRAEAPIAVQDHVRLLCKEYGIEWANRLILCQMFHESGYNPYIVSATNDHGYMQINICNYGYFSELGMDINDPYQNIKAGIYLMAKYIHKYGDVQMALVCYNMGEGTIRQGIYSTEYSRTILSLLEYNLRED